MTGTTIRLFGHPSVTTADPAYVFASPRHSLGVLAYVILHRGIPLARDTVARALWPDDDEAGVRGRLRRNLSVLLAALPPAPVPWIIATADHLRWNADADVWCDVAAFDRAAGDPGTYEKACAAYAGDLLPDLDDEWLVPIRARYRERYQRLLEDLIARRTAAGERRAARAHATALLASDPWREDVVRTLARLRFEDGDRAGALRTLGDFARVLHDELGVLPMPETVALRAAILGIAPARPRPAEPVIAPAAATVPVELPFGGRDRELGDLLAAWRRAAGGNGTATFVTGEAGVGKTRLLAEFARHVEVGGGRVLRGLTSPREARPYEAFSGALRSAVPYLAEAGLSPLLAGTLATLVPELDTGEVEPIAALDAVSERARLFEGTARGMIALARTRPLAILLEDLHAAGRTTIDLLRYVLGRLAHRPILVVATVRDGDAGDAALRAVMRETTSLRLATAVGLGRLSRADVEALCARHADLAVVAAASLLAERSDGHPLIVAELIRSMRGGVLGPSAIPRTVAESVAARLARASADARVAASCAAVIGAVFEVDLLRRVLGWNEGRASDALYDLLDARVVHAAEGRASFAYAFSHELVRDAIVARIEEGERRRLHRLVALGLERDGERASAAARADHWSHAGDAERAATAWVEASRAAFEMYANDDAERFAGHALAGVPGTAAQAFAAHRARIDAARRLGKIDVVRDDLAALDVLAPRADAAARRDLARLRVQLAFDVADVGAMREAMAHPDAVGAPHADLDRARLAALCSDWRASEAAAADAIAGCATAGDATARIDALVASAGALAHLGCYSDAQRRAEEADALAAERDDTPRRISALEASIRIASLRQDFERVRALAERQLALGRAVGDRVAEAKALGLLGVAAMRLHDHTEAIACTEGAMHVFAAVGNREAFATYETTYAAFLITLGRPERGREILVAARQRFEREGNRLRAYYAWSNGGRASAYLGETAVAVAEQRRALALANELDSDLLRSLVHGDLGAALATLGDPTNGALHLERAVAIHRAVGQRLSLTNNLGRLAAVQATLGRASEARACAREALERYDADSGALEEPAEILWTIARAAEAFGDAALAATTAERARVALLARLERMGDSPYRETYAALPWHRALLAAAPVTAAVAVAEPYLDARRG